MNKEIDYLNTEATFLLQVFVGSVVGISALIYITGCGLRLLIELVS